MTTPRSFPSRYRGPRPSQGLAPLAGPIEGVVEDLARVTNAERELAYLENGYLVEGRVRARPGFALLPAPDDFPAAIPIQGMGYAVSQEGANVNWLVADGRLWIGVDEAPTTEVDLTATPLSATSERVYGVMFANHLILSDGVTRPVKVLLTDFTPSYLTYFDHPAYGPPVVYYDKLFFIRADKRIEMQWSEEGDPNNGYTGPCAAGGNFNNAWELRQADTDALSLLVPSNAALVFFRQRGAGIIQGPATDDFQADGTRDSLGQDIGTLSPSGAALLDNGTLWFVDQFGRPSLAQLAGGVEEIVGPQVDLRSTLNRATLERVLLTHSAELGLILVAHPLSGSWPTTLLVFRDGAGGDTRYQGRWTLPAGTELRAIGVWRISLLDQPEVTVLGDSQGRAWGFLSPLPVTHEDVLSVDGLTTAAFTRLARTAPLAYSPTVTKQFHTLTAQVAAPPGAAATLTGALLVSYLTPLNASVPTAITPNLAGGASAITGPSTQAPVVAQAGLAAFGTSIQLTCSTSTPDSAYDLVALGVEGFVDGAQPQPA